MTTVDLTNCPVVIGNADTIIAAMQTILHNQHVCIAYHNDSHSPGASVLVDYVLEDIELEIAESPSGQTYMLLYFLSADGTSYQLDVDFDVSPFSSMLSIEPGLIRITDYRRGRSEHEPDPCPCGWTTLSWIPEKAPTQTLAELITSARRREAQRDNVRELDLSSHAHFRAYCLETFGSQILDGSIWTVNLVPSPWYPNEVALELALVEDGLQFILHYAWHGSDMPCWHLQLLHNEEANIGLFYATCPLVMRDRLVLAIDELRTGAGPWPRVAGWSDEVARPR